jgi:hypothetical protein
MKKIALGLLSTLVLFVGTATGQSPAQAKSNLAKAVSLSGRVSEDGKNLITRDGQAWSITNLGALSGHEGRQGKAKCQIAAGTHDILVLSVKAIATQIKYVANPGDAAFRR